eukprot:5003446-Pyramimonas_sp.AAC.1
MTTWRRCSSSVRPSENAKFVGWNPDSLISPSGRTDSISYEFRNQCGILCPGTHIRQIAQLSHYREESRYYIWIHWDGGRSPHVTSACGCSTAICKRHFLPSA